MVLSMKNLRPLAILSFLFCALLFTGCGPSGPVEYPVSGVVTYQGKPLSLGTIFFQPKGGKMAVATIDKKGRYSLKVVEGTSRVTIQAIPPSPPGRDNPLEPGYVAPKSLIPLRYSKATQSDLDAEVKPSDANVISFDLK